MSTYLCAYSPYYGMPTTEGYKFPVAVYDMSREIVYNSIEDGPEAGKVEDAVKFFLKDEELWDTDWENEINLVKNVHPIEFFLGG